VLIADRLHLVRLANDTVTAVRQRVIREHEGRRGRRTDPAWRVRRRLLTAHERLRPETFAKMWNALAHNGPRGRRSCTPTSSKIDLHTMLVTSVEPVDQLIQDCGGALHRHPMRTRNFR